MRIRSLTPTTRPPAGSKEHPSLSGLAPFGSRLVQTDGQVVLFVSGEIDRSTVDQFSAAVRQALNPGRRLVVDMSETTFMSVDGLRVLLGAIHQFGENPDALVIRSPTSIIALLMRLTGVDALLTVDDKPIEPPIGPERGSVHWGNAGCPARTVMVDG